MGKYGMAQRIKTLELYYKHLMSIVLIYRAYVLHYGVHSIFTFKIYDDLFDTANFDKRGSVCDFVKICADIRMTSAQTKLMSTVSSIRRAPTHDRADSQLPR